MIPYLVAGLGGAWLASRKKPHSDVKKREMIGPKSGIEYEVDDVEGVIIVHGPGGVGVFKRNDGRPGFSFVKGKGNQQLLSWMIKDFHSPPPPPLERQKK